MAATAATAPGLIEPHVLYVMGEFCRRAGWPRKTWDAAKRRGLKVLRSGKRCYIRGSDAIAFIEKDATEQAARLAQATS